MLGLGFGIKSGTHALFVPKEGTPCVSALGLATGGVEFTQKASVTLGVARCLNKSDVLRAAERVHMECE